MIYFYCTSWQFFQMIVKWRISPTTEQIMFTFSILLFHFYSHIPCGMWRIPKLKHFVLLRFLLTHPVWDVTQICPGKPAAYHISTHTSRVGCDYMRVSRNYFVDYYFYSHIPCGMWPIIQKCAPLTILFLLTHPVWDVTKRLYQNDIDW